MLNGRTFAVNLFDAFFSTIEKNDLARFHEQFREALSAGYQPEQHGDYRQWTAAFARLPDCENARLSVSQDIIEIGHADNLNKEQHQALHAALRALMPWRKGPYCFFGRHIDTEWRSDLKWQRLKPHITPLTDRLVLDVGCGSGYHCWRMLGEGANFVLGIDPSPKFIFQFEAVRKYNPLAPVFYLPLPLESLPPNLQSFDTVFSMGVIYHRRSPFDHIDELKAALRAGGELIMETLVVSGNEDTVLTPANRYAQMRNVWFIGSSLATKRWLERCGFQNVRIVDETVTTSEEQRKTDWMQFNSLPDFLDPRDHSKTVEGYPAPRRAILIAQKPG